jgi:predicted TPR repeat methyltransferase
MAYGKLADVYDDVLVGEGAHARWAEFLDGLWRGEVRRVLDVCCGTGLLAAELVARGYEVVGVDGSEAMLAQARRRVDAPFHCSMLPALGVEGEFDAAVSTFDGFNYLSPDELRSSFGALAGVVRAGGWLVFDLHTDEEMRFMAANPVVESGGFRLTSVVDEVARTCEMTLEGEAFTEHHLEYFHRPADVRSSLEAAGFEVASVRDDYSDRAAGESTQTAVWIARRA